MVPSPLAVPLRPPTISSFQSHVVPHAAPSGSLAICGGQKGKSGTLMGVVECPSDDVFHYQPRRPHSSLSKLLSLHRI